MRRYLHTMLLGAALMAPLSVNAYDDHPKRYYDPDRRDYHEWNEHEERAYQRWLDENHRAHREWRRANKHEQREYWRWRHDHPDIDRH
jgi:hypothetical protein